jgi:hypothetical protein
MTPDERRRARLRRWRDHWLWCLILTVAFEAGTCFLRFGLDYQTSRDTAYLKAFTFGLRIHHGYIGLFMLLTLPLFRRDRWLWPWIFRIGMALVLSDLIHHFLVLWPVTGGPQFDLFYPP